MATQPVTATSTRRRQIGGRTRSATGTMSSRKLPLGQQLILQAICLFIALTVLFPILWVVSIALNPSNISHPTDIIPPGATLKAFGDVINQPTSNPVSFAQLAFNSIKIALGTSVLSVAVGVLAAYAFSRFRFSGRNTIFFAIGGVLMLPGIATIAPLFVLLNKVQFDALDFGPLHLDAFNLRNSLLGVGLALLSGMLPFAIWNLKGYLDTIPKELEEAAAIDGATRNKIFTRIVLPLSTPVLAVTAFFGFLSGWTEFALSWQFLNNPQDFTLGMALNGMVGQYARTTPWSKFSAMALLVAVPVSIVYLFLQRYIVSGLTIGGVKG